MLIDVKPEAPGFVGNRGRTGMRHKPSIIDLLREETGRDYVPAAPSDEQRWQWLDYFILPRPDLLELTGMPKGRFESYLRRRLLDLKHFGVGMGTHIRYKPLEALKLMAIDGLSRSLFSIHHATLSYMYQIDRVSSTDRRVPPFTFQFLFLR